MEDYFTAPGRCGRTADLTSDLRYFADHDFGASFFARVPVVFTEFIFYSFEFSTVLFTLFYFVSFRTKSRNGRTLRQIRFICNILSSTVLPQYCRKLYISDFNCEKMNTR